MNLNYMAIAVPFFLLFIGVEYWFSKRLGKPVFIFSSSIANMNTGVADRLIDMFTAGAFFFFYDYLHQQFSVFDIKPTILTWIFLVLSTDLIWYWYHRMGHKINLFWGFHVVHHTSEEFNYTAGTRITIFQALVRTLFWSVLPVIGCIVLHFAKTISELNIWKITLKNTLEIFLSGSVLTPFQVYETISTSLFIISNCIDRNGNFKKHMGSGAVRCFIAGNPSRHSKAECAWKRIIFRGTPRR